MPQQSLTDTHFFLHGESESVTLALSRYLQTEGAAVTELTRLENLHFSDETENVLVVHYSGAEGLINKLPKLKKHSGSLRVLLLHEFIERGRIPGGVLSATDHLLEKPFTRSSLQKGLNQFRFHPLSGKSVFIFRSGEDNMAELLLRMLGATVVESLPSDGQRLPLELAIFSPAELDDRFRAVVADFRNQYVDVPVFMLYDPQAPGILDSAILSEIAYLVQKPVSRRVLREKILAFFEQPQRDRRKNPRKKGISQIWISAFNPELGAPELFESPFLIDISQSGLSFHSHMDYHENQAMSVWVVAEEHPDKIIDLKGVIRWRRQEAAEISGIAAYKYGVEFTRQDSAAYTSFARMIAMHTG
jgi:hypothetical protein